MLTASIAYLNDATADLWKYYYLSNLSFARTTLVTGKTLLTLGALPLAYFLISLVMLNREARFSKYQSQIVQVIFVWLAFSILFVFYAKDLRPQTLIVFIPGLSLLLTHFFLLIRRKKFIHLNSWILFAGIIGVAYLARLNKIDSVNYDRLLVKDGPSDLRGKRILVLDSRPEIYRANYLATPFLDWELSKEIFTNPDYYQNVTRVYHSFEKDPPDVVIDKQDLMSSFFYRMPDVEKQYVRIGERYVRRVSN